MEKLQEKNHKLSVTGGVRYAERATGKQIDKYSSRKKDPNVQAGFNHVKNDAKQIENPHGSGRKWCGERA